MPNNKNKGKDKKEPTRGIRVRCPLRKALDVRHTDGDYGPLDRQYWEYIERLVAEVPVTDAAAALPIRLRYESGDANVRECIEGLFKSSNSVRSYFSFAASWLAPYSTNYSDQPFGVQLALATLWYRKETPGQDTSSAASSVSPLPHSPILSMAPPPPICTLDPPLQICTSPPVSTSSPVAPPALPSLASQLSPPHTQSVSDQLSPLLYTAPPQVQDGAGVVISTSTSTPISPSTPPSTLKPIELCPRWSRALAHFQWDVCPEDLTNCPVFFKTNQFHMLCDIIKQGRAKDTIYTVWGESENTPSFDIHEVAKELSLPPEAYNEYSFKDLLEIGPLKEELAQHPPEKHFLLHLFDCELEKDDSGQFKAALQNLLLLKAAFPNVVMFLSGSDALCLLHSPIPLGTFQSCLSNILDDDMVFLALKLFFGVSNTLFGKNPAKDMRRISSLHSAQRSLFLDFLQIVKDMCCAGTLGSLPCWNEIIEKTWQRKRQRIDGTESQANILHQFFMLGYKILLDIGSCLNKQGIAVVIPVPGGLKVTYPPAWACAMVCAPERKLMDVPALQFWRQVKEITGNLFEYNMVTELVRSWSQIHNIVYNGDSYYFVDSNLRPLIKVFHALSEASIDSLVTERCSFWVSDRGNCTWEKTDFRTYAILREKHAHLQGPLPRYISVDFQFSTGGRHLAILRKCLEFLLVCKARQEPGLFYFVSDWDFMNLQKDHSNEKRIECLNIKKQIEELLRGSQGIRQPYMEFKINAGYQNFKSCPNVLVCLDPPISHKRPEYEVPQYIWMGDDISATPHKKSRVEDEKKSPEKRLSAVKKFMTEKEQLDVAESIESLLLYPPFLNVINDSAPSAAVAQRVLTFVGDAQKARLSSLIVLLQLSTDDQDFVSQLPATNGLMQDLILWQTCTPLTRQKKIAELRSKNANSRS
ncbi:hypothetical protein Pelo_3457 [Pelomyxa schiedti]|nr:hypothetical protein Pelo_3457 [Pelomyxa schiedti]